MAASAAVLLCAAVFLMVWRGGGAFRLNIDGLPVTVEEYRRAMDSQTYEIANELAEQYGLQSSPGFWLQKAGDTDAYRILADRTVEALCRYRALYSLAKEQGYVEDISYSGLLKRMENENRDRAEKRARGETVYGLSSFTVDTFLTYEEDAIQKQYSDQPDNPGMDIDETAARAGYEDMKEGYFRRSDSIGVVWIKIPYEELALDRDLFYGKLEELSAADGALETLASADLELSPYLGQKSLDYGDYRAASVEMPDILELADSLEEGTRTAVCDKNGALYLVECTARTPGGYIPYEEARDYVLKTMREEAFDQLIAQRAAEAAVTGDMEGVYRVTQKAVQ